jgi:hypothetical protein
MFIDSDLPSMNPLWGKRSVTHRTCQHIYAATVAGLVTTGCFSRQMDAKRSTTYCWLPAIRQGKLK